MRPPTTLRSETADLRSPTWRDLLARAIARLQDAGLPNPEIDGRRIVEEASDTEGSDKLLYLDDHATARTFGHWQSMVARRERGEPLQYVVGRWAFRDLDLFVDRRVLIPRPETEVVVTHALAELDRLDGQVAVDLGTGCGAIGLSLVAERTDVEVWATDASDEALDVARANSAGLGRAARRLRILQGDWLEALPSSLRGHVDLVVSNPPYVGTTDLLPAEVAEWEPPSALFAGPSGLEATELIIRQSAEWLAGPGVLVLEIGERHGAAVQDLARGAGFAWTAVHQDLAGRDRVLVARR